MPSKHASHFLLSLRWLPTSYNLQATKAKFITGLWTAAQRKRLHIIAVKMLFTVERLRAKSGIVFVLFSHRGVSLLVCVLTRSGNYTVGCSVHFQAFHVKVSCRWVTDNDSHLNHLNRWPLDLQERQLTIKLLGQERVRTITTVGQ